MTPAPPPVAVGIVPAAEHDRRRGLFGALEAALPVRFEGRAANALGDLGAVIEIGGEAAASRAAATAIPSLAMLVVEAEAPGAIELMTLTEEAELDHRLRGAALPDAHLGPGIASGQRIEIAQGAAVLAGAAATALWVRAGSHQVSLLAPLELGAEEALRERICDGRSAALLPLVHFLRELTGPIRWQPPTPRASFLFDDPNLHWPSYGFVKLAGLGAHAREHGYHAALATVPLDAWFSHPAALRALRESRGAISLLVHGNDHYGAELGRVESEARAVALGAQALRRVEAFERRTGAHVDRIMVPPHEQCSAATARGLRRCGFEAITMTRPFPWLANPPRTWLARPRGTAPLTGWGPADCAEGLPVMLRHPIVGRSPAELALRSFLDQPLILYGHQGDLLGGLDLLAAAAADVNRLGERRWCSLGEIAAGSFETRFAGTELGVRLLGRRAQVKIPEGTERIVVEVAAADAPAGLLLVNRRHQRLGEPVAVEAGASLEIELHCPDRIDVHSAPRPPRQPLALPRRALSEGRDRLAPLVSRAR